MTAPSFFYFCLSHYHFPVLLSLFILSLFIPFLPFSFFVCMAYGRLATLQACMHYYPIPICKCVFFFFFSFLFVSLLLL